MYAKSEMEESQVEAQYHDLVKQTDTALQDSTQSYINLKIECGVITGCYVGELPTTQSGYQPMDLASNTPLYFRYEGLTKWKERVREIFLGTLVYDIPMQQDFVVRMLGRLLDELPHHVKTTKHYVETGTLRNFKTKELQYSNVVNGSEIDDCLKNGTLPECLDRFCHYFDTHFSPEQKGLYAHITSQGLESYIHTLKIGRTYDEFEDELSQTVGYFNRMVNLLEEIQGQTTFSKHTRHKKMVTL